jgi:Copine/C2 domain
MSTTRLQLHLSAKGLKNLGGLMGKSDPFAVVTVRGDNPNNKPVVVGQTDVYVCVSIFGNSFEFQDVNIFFFTSSAELCSVFNNLDPAWSRVVFIDGYKFGVPLYFEVGVFDFDASQTGKTEQELSRMDAFSQAVITSNAASRALMRDGKFPHKVMGTALFEVGQVLGSRGNVGSKSLQNGGALYVNIERSMPDGESGKIHLQLRGIKLKNRQTLGRVSSPFYELYRRIDRPTGASWISVYRSNACRADLNPLWMGSTLDIEATCNGDLNRSMKLIVWDHRKTGKHKLMGEFETSMRGFIEAGMEQQGMGFTLHSDGDKEVGTIQVLEALLSEPVHNRALSPGGPWKTEPKESRIASPHPAKPKEAAIVKTNNSDRPEFVDYLSGGCQISLAVAIDFTASNGDPRQPGTPHYFHPPESKEWNDYEKAIFAVGSILAKYDSDQRFPVWGFGAKYNNVVRHCFQCGTDVEVDGVQGIMDAYRGVFRTPLTMSYPTKLMEVIQTAAAYARHEQVCQWRLVFFS